jgi:hypothetical protein
MTAALVDLACRCDCASSPCAAPEAHRLDGVPANLFERCNVLYTRYTLIMQGRQPASTLPHEPDHLVLELDAVKADAVKLVAYLQTSELVLDGYGLESLQRFALFAAAHDCHPRGCPRGTRSLLLLAGEQLVAGLSIYSPNDLLQIFAVPPAQQLSALEREQAKTEFAFAAYQPCPTAPAGPD